MRVFLGLALIFSLSPLVEASTFAPSSFASSTKKHPQHHQSLEMLLDVRGGGGIAIDKDTVAQVATTVSLVHGTINQMCPKVTCETYGVKDSPVVTFLMRRLGTTLISFGILSYSIFCQNWSKEVGMTLVAFVWIVEFLTAYLNKEFEDVSMSLVFAGIMMALIVGNRSQYSAESMKFQAVFTAFNSISFMLSPKVSLKTWKMPTSSLNDPVAVSMASDIGRWLGALSIMQLFLAFGGDAMTGFAYARLAILARYLLVNFVTNEANKMGMKKSQQMFWILYNAVVAAALLLM